MNFTRRLKALERPFREEKIFRMVVQSHVGELNLETSTCIRTRGRDGAISEWIHFDGNAEHLTAEQIQSFVDGFPIKYYG